MHSLARLQAFRPSSPPSKFWGTSSWRFGIHNTMAFLVVSTRLIWSRTQRQKTRFSGCWPMARRVSIVFLSPYTFLTAMNLVGI